MPSVFDEAWFHMTYPGWSHQDYMDAPDELIVQMELLASVRVEVGDSS